MDWGFITHHLVSGYIPVVVALVVYFILMHVIGKKQTVAHIIVSFFWLLSRWNTDDDRNLHRWSILSKICVYSF